MHPLVAPLVVSLALGQATSPAAEAVAPSAVRSRALAPAVLGGVTLATGATFLIIGEVQWARAGSLPTREAVDAARGNATSNVVGGVALLGFGALTAGLAAILLFWVPTPPGTQVALSPLQGGGLVSLGLRLP
ncbi:MAG: hypothetical protein AB1730_17815 [Myxococcota bacterium]|jgi:hypothetical protein